MWKFMFEHVIYVRINEGNFCSLSIYLDWCWLLFMYKAIEAFITLVFGIYPYPFSYIIRQIYKQYYKLILEFCENTHIQTHFYILKQTHSMKILQLLWIGKEGNGKYDNSWVIQWKSRKWPRLTFMRCVPFKFYVLATPHPRITLLIFHVLNSLLSSNFTSIVLHIIIFYKLVFGKRM